MKIKLVFPRGFCAGVNMSTSALQTALDRFGAPIYVYHEIVHNKNVVWYFQRQGVVFVESLSEVPDHSVLLFSAHGVSPAIVNQAHGKGLTCIDAACPLVKKVHREAKRFVEQGYTVFLIGHAKHDEVVGTQGEAPDHIYVVNDRESVDRWNLPKSGRYAFVTQTTLSMDEADAIIAYLKQKYPEIVGPNRGDICYATQNRQQAVRQFSVGCNKALVVGSSNSSNSQRLAEIARKEGLDAFLIEGPENLSVDQFRNDDCVLLTAGASAHECVVQMALEWFRTNFHATVEEYRLCEENTAFLLPEPLRNTVTT